MSNSSRAAIALALVLAVAATVRVWNLDWSLPSLTEEAAPVHEAIEMWGFETGKPNLDPETAGWPALSFYVQHGLQRLQFVSGDFGDPLDYYVSWRLDPTGPVMLARWTAVVCLLGVVVVAFLVGRRLADLPGALTAGALCAVSPLLVRHAQLVEPDALVALFSALALLWLLKVARRGSVADYVWCGVWIGLGAASKYTPALLALSLLAVHVDRLRSEGAGRLLGLADRRIWLAAAGVMGAFIVTNPYFLGDLDVLRRDFGYQATHMSAGHFGHTEHGLGYVRYLFGVLPGALGVLGFLAGIAGLVLGFRDRAVRTVVYYLLPWILVLGALSTSFDRYMLPAVLPLAIGAGLLVAKIRRPVIAGLAIAVLLVQPAFATWEYQRLQSVEDTRDLARAWVLENVDREAQTLAMEYHGPDLEFGAPERIAAEPVFERLSEAQRQQLLDGASFRAVRIPMYSVRADLTAFYYDPGHYLAYDWLLVSGGVSRRYRANPDRFSTQVAFYDFIEEIAEPAWSIAPAGTMRGPAIDIYRVDDAFRSAVRQRYSEPSPEQLAAWGDRVHPPHYIDFLLSVAEHAEFREQWRQAALYYGTVAGAAADPDLHALGLEKCGAMLFSAGELDQSARWYQQLAEIPSHRMVALGNLGLIAERQGDYDTARARYEELLGSSEFGDWARDRLAALPD